MATENTSAAVGAASSATGSGVQVENEAFQLHGADHQGFMYTKSSRSLWLDLEERYGRCNGPQLYQLQCEITVLSQGNMTVEAYYTKLRRLWDELEVLMPTPQCTCNGCTCGLSKAISDLALFTQLMQFLMGLGEVFDHVRHQLLVMDLIPSVNRAYSMIHGTPDWYKDLVEQKRKDGNGSGSGRNFAANTEERKVQPHLNEDSKELLLKELIKLVRGSGTQPESIQQVNFAQLDDFAGINCTLTRLGDNDLSYWIVDTGATNHICASPHILSNLVNPSFPTTDQGSKKILAVGKMIDNLYVLDNSSFSPSTIQTFTLQQGSCFAAQSSQNNLWHKRLGHPSFLPTKFWGESVLTATYLINWLPTPLLHWKSPFEVLHQKPPDYTRLKLFGCLCYASNNSPHKETSFHETTYPFQSTPPETDPVSLPLPTIDTDPIIDSPTSTPAPTDSLNGSPTVLVSPNISPSDISIPLPSLTRPHKHTSKPAWMNDYVCSCAASSSSCIPDSFSLAHICFVAQCSSMQEPKTYLQASKVLVGWQRCKRNCRLWIEMVHGS
ncbi:UNVERIFIED_CONTAM: Retrovirus-related Pol polyprotein from transposon RE2 [Sesamum radiatum]|uniref:Retrovirus-related Pol polyprotein from transposon RE2 n=1 Tax=Sesamum radiatum TaxID=300843 RepID=A0AAW2LBE3_SESRA